MKYKIVAADAEHTFVSSGRFKPPEEDSDYGDLEEWEVCWQLVVTQDDTTVRVCDFPRLSYIHDVTSWLP